MSMGKSVCVGDFENNNWEKYIKKTTSTSQSKKKRNVWKKYRFKLGPGLMDAARLAKYLKIKKNTVYIMVSQNRIPYSKVGRCTRFIKETIDRWLDDNSMGARTV